MKESNVRELVGGLRFQRNLLVAVCSVLACTSVLSTSLLFTKNERVVIIPPTLDQSLWVEGNRVSSAYLEKWGVFVGNLLLTRSSTSAASSRELLLRHSDGEYLPALRQKLLEEEKSLKKQNISYVFYVSQVKVNPEALRVTLTGDRKTYVGDKKVSMNKESYQMQFVMTGGRMLLTGVKEVENA